MLYDIFFWVLCRIYDGWLQGMTPTWATACAIMFLVLVYRGMKSKIICLAFSFSFLVFYQMFWAFLYFTYRKIFVSCGLYLAVRPGSLECGSVGTVTGMLERGNFDNWVFVMEHVLGWVLWSYSLGYVSPEVSTACKSWVGSLCSPVHSRLLQWAAFLQAHLSCFFFSASSTTPL